MEAHASHEGFLTLLKKKDFLRLWLAQLISMTILNASNYALLVLIEEVTGSTTLVGLAIICFSLPALLFGAPAGVFVDRVNKRRVLWVSNCLRAVATLGFVISLLTNRHQLIPIYLLTFLISSIGQFFTPAEGSAIPRLINEDELMPALSLFNITFMLSQALGFILFAPIILSLIPPFTLFGMFIDPIDTLYFIIALLYAVCAILIALIPASHFNHLEKHNFEHITTQSLSAINNVWQEMHQAWSFIRRNKRLSLAVIQLSFAGTLLLVIGELATPIVTRLLLFAPNDMAFVFAPAGIGLILGSILMPHITKHIGKSHAILIGSISLAICTLLLPLVTLLAHKLLPHGWSPDPLSNPLLLLAVALIMFIAGIALDFINIPAQTAIQEQTPDWIKGRVLAMQLTLYNAGSIPIILFIGAIADLFGMNNVLYLMPISVIAFGFWSLYFEHKYKQTILYHVEKTEIHVELDEITS
jgi:MFS family permease